MSLPDQCLITYSFQGIVDLLGQRQEGVSWGIIKNTAIEKYLADSAHEKYCAIVYIPTTKIIIKLKQKQTVETFPEKFVLRQTNLKTNKLISYIVVIEVYVIFTMIIPVLKQGHLLLLPQTTTKHYHTKLQILLISTYDAKNKSR